MSPREENRTNLNVTPENSLSSCGGVSGQHQNEETLNGKRREVGTKISQKQNFSQLRSSSGDFVECVFFN